MATHDGDVDVKGLEPETRITGSEATDSLRLDTLDGNDRVQVDGGVFGLISPIVDLGAGQA